MSLRRRCEMTTMGAHPQSMVCRIAVPDAGSHFAAGVWGRPHGAGDPSPPR